MPATFVSFKTLPNYFIAIPRVQMI